MFTDFEIKQLTSSPVSEPVISEHKAKKINASQVLEDYFSNGRKRTIKQTIIDNNLKDSVVRNWLRTNCKIDETVRPMLWSKK